MVSRGRRTPDATRGRGPGAPRSRYPEAEMEVRMPQAERIADVLAGRMPAGTRVTVQGWVRTRRDSKAGLSFLHLHDGSCFDALQVVAPPRCRTTRTRSCGSPPAAPSPSTGTVAPSQGQGQARGGARRLGRRSSAGWTTRRPTRSSRSGTPSSTSARSATCGCARTRSGRSPGSGTPWPWPCTASSTSAASTGSTRRS